MGLTQSAPRPLITCSDECLERLRLQDVAKESASEDQLRDLDGWWSRKLKVLDREHSERHGLTDAAFEKAVMDVETSYAMLTKTKPCHVGTYRQQVQRCYQYHNDKTLICHKEAVDFMSCIDTKITTRIKEAV